MPRDMAMVAGGVLVALFIVAIFRGGVALATLDIPWLDPWHLVGWAMIALALAAGAWVALVFTGIVQCPSFSPRALCPA